MDLPEKLAFVDIETTGGSFARDRVIEIGILRVENGKVKKKWESLINPDAYIPREIESITGINADMLNSAPSFRQVHEIVEELLDDCIFVAHNARFDYGFLKSEFRNVGKDWRVRQLCTRKLSQRLFPRFRRHSLDSLIERFGLTCERRHRAFDDAKVLWDFYSHVLHTVPLEKLTQVLKELLRRPSLPAALSSIKLNSLPEGPGVYIFYANDGAPLYVGKSINIRERILSHFSQDTQVSREFKITQTIASIETHKTVGELGALLLESDLIKKLKPLHNRLQRHAYELVGLVKTETPDGYLSVRLEQLREITPEMLPTLYGIFRSKRQAKEALVGLSKKYKLCQKLLGLENGQGNCFGYGLKTCNGACVGKEKTAFYNLRFIEAFTHLKIRRWPFASPVVIEERNEEGEVHAHIVDQWCYLGSSTGDEAGLTGRPARDIHFDHDIYKILQKAILHPHSQRKLQIREVNDHKRIENVFL